MTSSFDPISYQTSLSPMRSHYGADITTELSSQDSIAILGLFGDSVDPGGMSGSACLKYVQSAHNSILYRQTALDEQLVPSFDPTEHSVDHKSSPNRQPPIFYLRAGLASTNDISRCRAPRS